MSFRTPGPRVIQCGDPTDRNARPQGEPLLSGLVKGGVLTATGLEVTLTRINSTGTDGWYKGEGWVSVPFLGNASFGVEFDNIFINTDREVTRGEIRFMSQPIDQWIDQTIARQEENQELRRQRQANREQWKDVEFDEHITLYDQTDLESVLMAADGTVTLVDQAGRQYAAAAEDIPRPITKPLLIEDGNGDQWVVDKNGKVTAVPGGGLPDLKETVRATLANLGILDVLEQLKEKLADPKANAQEIKRLAASLPLEMEEAIANAALSENEKQALREQASGLYEKLQTANLDRLEEGNEAHLALQQENQAVIDELHRVEMRIVAPVLISEQTPLPTSEPDGFTAITRKRLEGSKTHCTTAKFIHSTQDGRHKACFYMDVEDKKSERMVVLYYFGRPFLAQTNREIHYWNFRVRNPDGNGYAEYGVTEEELFGVPVYLYTVRQKDGGWSVWRTFNPVEGPSAAGAFSDMAQQVVFYTAATLITGGFGAEAKGMQVAGEVVEAFIDALRTYEGDWTAIPKHTLEQLVSQKLLGKGLKVTIRFSAKAYKGILSMLHWGKKALGLDAMSAKMRQLAANINPSAPVPPKADEYVSWGDELSDGTRMIEQPFVKSDVDELFRAIKDEPDFVGFRTLCKNNPNIEVELAGDDWEKFVISTKSTYGISTERNLAIINFDGKDYLVASSPKFSSQMESSGKFIPKNFYDLLKMMETGYLITQ